MGRMVTSATNPNGSHQDEEGRYCRPGDKHRTRGFKRAHLYALEKRGLVRFVRIKSPGAKRGITLLDLWSLDALIQKSSGRGE